MISCKLISTKEILALKKKMAYNAEKNKQTNKTNTGKSYKKFYRQTFGEKRILPKPNHPYPPPPPLPPLKSQMVDPYSVRFQSHVQAFKQEEQDVLWRKTTTTTRTSYWGI